MRDVYPEELQLMEQEILAYYEQEQASGKSRSKPRKMSKMATQRGPKDAMVAPVVALPIAATGSAAAGSAAATTGAASVAGGDASGRHLGDQGSARQTLEMPDAVKQGFLDHPHGIFHQANHPQDGAGTKKRVRSGVNVLHICFECDVVVHPRMF